MKFNNKGFAISTIMYLILILAVILITATLAILSSRKLILDKQKSEALKSIYDRLLPKICTEVTEETKTTGNVPTGEYNVGDEYVCDVDGTNKYHFFVLSSEGNNVNLILDRTINNAGQLSTSSSNSLTSWLSTTEGSQASDGPITAFNFLSNSTTAWNNIPTISINYTYKGTTSGGFITNTTSTTTTVSILNTSGETTATYENLKVRLPYESELTSAGCTEASGSCPLWLSNYLLGSSSLGGTSLSGILGYWTIPTTSDFDVKVVSESGNIVGKSVFGSISNSSIIGVRPVISISKI